MINPYQPSTPAPVDEIPVSSPLLDTLQVNVEEVPETSDERPHLIKTFGKWLVICSASAAPSFMLGALVTESQYLGMLTGIFLFVLGYVWLDRHTWQYSWRRDRVIRRILRVIYTTRIVISVSFIGTPLDMMCGIAAMSATAFIFQSFAAGESFGAGGPTGFAAALIGTLFQGTILNAVLVLYGLFLFGVRAIYLRWSNRE